MKFTKLEKQILLHRLEVAECIVNCLTEDELNSDGTYTPSPYTALDVESAIEGLKSALENDADFTPERVMKLSSVAFADVLFDCIDGSTWCGTMVCEVDFTITKQKFATHQRAVESLAEKCFQLTGKRPNAPTC